PPVGRVTKPADRTFTEMFRQANAGPAADGIRAELDNIMKMVGDAAPVEPKPINDWVRENAKLNLFDETVQPSAALGNLLTGQAQVLRNLPVGSVGRLARIAGGEQFPREIRAEAANLVKRFYAASQAAMKSDVTDALTAFNMRRARQEDAVRAGLGNELYGFLESKADGKAGAKAFEKIVRDLGRLADPAADLSVFDRVGA